ncbi:helix-turn-helix domain-containing protein [Massilia solisilvae]|uniref:Helix-turn-helix domain-containing protein n=1 Tax=Massilia solisilvae TaxID=1811225 RepID=A0ABT2BDW1_9BURK|nr:helix-turn-helix domain-containing protein [Massilia solisilvae]MCS0606714.1 helix-turn-helix domain-containing protein [Massilia solisilvae]
MQLREVGMHVHDRRKEIGLSQAQLARLAGLSRTTVNQLESGALEDLGYTKLSQLLGILGLTFDAKERLKKSPALKIAAQTASTSYKKILTSDVLKNILKSGVVPDDFKPHVMTLLDETPLPLVVSAIKEASVETNTPPKTVMKNVSAMAKELQTHRAVW